MPYMSGMAVRSPWQKRAREDLTVNLRGLADKLEWMGLTSDGERRERQEEMLQKKIPSDCVECCCETWMRSRQTSDFDLKSWRLPVILEGEICLNLSNYCMFWIILLHKWMEKRMWQWCYVIGRKYSCEEWFGDEGEGDFWIINCSLNGKPNGTVTDCREWSKRMIQMILFWSKTRGM